MKLFKKTTAIFLVLSLFILPHISAATSPGLGQASTFAILSDTYSNSAGGTTINGDVGYTTPPATAPTINGNVHMADSTYNQAGIDQGSALTNLNNQPCSYSFPSGAIDLATDVNHGTVGVYLPGIYCIDGAGSIGGGGTITLNGAGTYIFRMVGALTTSANSVVAVANGATSCDVWWTPTAATTLGANSRFRGTDITAAGITIGNNVTWTGRSLAFGGTVSTDSDTISVPACGGAVEVSDLANTATGVANNTVSTQSNMVIAFSAIILVAAFNIDRIKKFVNKSK